MDSKILNRDISLIIKNGNESYPIFFDVVDSINISSNAELTQYPLVEGGTIVDHMFMTPKSITVNGKFGTSGKRKEAYKLVEKDKKFKVEILEGIKDRLEKIKVFFEDLQKNNILMRIKTGYSIDDNFVLNNLSFTILPESIDFNFTFTEVQFGQLSIVVEKTNVKDPNLPEIMDFSPQSFTQGLLSGEETINFIAAVLKECDLADDSFFIAFGKTIGITISAASLTAGLITIATIMAVNMSNPIGWLANLAIFSLLVIASAIYAIIKIWKNWKRRRTYKIEQFQKFKEEKKQLKENKRYLKLNEGIIGHISQLDRTSAVYNIITDSNHVEAYLNVDGENLKFKFDRPNNFSNCFVEVFNVEDKVIVNRKEIKFKSSVFTLTNNDYLCKIGNNSIYFINDSKDKEPQKKLSNFKILVSNLDFDEFSKTLGEIIKNSIKW